MIYKYGTQYPNVQSLNVNSRFKRKWHCWM